MKKEKRNRVIFFSKEDMAGPLKLKLAEPIIKDFDSKKNYDINDIIELFQIKQYSDNDLYLSDWSAEFIADYKETAERIWKTVCNFWVNIDNDSFIDLYNQVEFEFRRDFWELTEQLQIFKKIEKITFSILLNGENFWIQNVLKQKRLVKYFSSTIRDFLLVYEKSAELLLTQFEQEHTSQHPDLFFPNNLSINDIEKIINDYLDRPDSNLNYVRLIINAKELKFSPKTRLKAIKVERIKNEEILESGYVWKADNQVGLSATQEEPVKLIWEDNIQKITYSTLWLDSLTDKYSLFYNFSLLFEYTDSFGNITLVSNSIEMDVMEHVLMRSKNDYKIGYAFNRKSNLSHLQIVVYDYYLREKGKSIEDILTFIIEDYFKNSYGLENLIINFPSESSTNLEKIRMLVPELESILKQFNLYSNNGEIDHELLQISSAPLRFKDVKSLVARKYLYGIGREFMNLRHYFFSDQSMLWYVEPFKDKKYQNLYSLLVNENVRLEDFENYQKPTIIELINSGYLEINGEQYVKIKKKITILVIGMLNKDEVVNYWILPEEFRIVIEEMEKNGLIRFGNTLFSEPEQKYFNYYLNKAEFTNGLDLRNRYVHGTNGDTDEEHRNIYFTILKLLVLAVLKMDNDLFVKKNRYSVNANESVDN
jgi:hypothetical protein